MSRHLDYRQASAVSECSGGPISSGHGVPFHLAATREAARIDVPDPFAIYRHYPTALLGPNTVVAVKSADLAADLARLREGKLNVHDAMAHAFLPRPAVDALLARLAAEPATAEDLAANHRGDRRQLLRTLLWLRKFDLVEFRGLQTANRPSDSMLRKP